MGEVISGSCPFFASCLLDKIFNNYHWSMGRLTKSVTFVPKPFGRCDSVHIFSNMRHLGRIGLFRHMIKKFLINVKRHHKDLFEALDKGLRDRYLSKQEEAVFSLVKPSESIGTLENLGANLFFLIERFKDHGAITAMSSYQLMIRLLKEQCHVEQDSQTHVKRVSIKPNPYKASRCQ